MSKSKYGKIIEHIFFAHYSARKKRFDFDREEILSAAKELAIEAPRNLGDVVYSFRYRKRLPQAIRDTCKENKEWIIRGVGRSKYRFLSVPITKIEPNPNLLETKIPDSTPEIVTRYALNDEQALLAKIRYNRLIDIFTGIVTYSLQNHLRTAVLGVQLEIDEVYVGISKTGTQYILPVQAKTGSDKIGRVQLEQDLGLCGERFPNLVCRAIAAQFMANDVIALFELIVDSKQTVRIVQERHYRLVPASEISDSDLESMKRIEQTV